MPGKAPRIDLVSVMNAENLGDSRSEVWAYVYRPDKIVGRTVQLPANSVCGPRETMDLPAATGRQQLHLDVFEAAESGQRRCAGAHDRKAVAGKPAAV